jgi:pimeloyl-ACP methyl ester carboxylesterase
MFVREAGDGPPILFLHGFPQTGRCWAPVARNLGGSHRIVAPDLPGFGRSARPRAYDLATVAGTVVATMDALGIEKTGVVGHDFGGAVAFRLALSYPDRVERLGIINSPYRKLDLRHGWHMLLFNLPVLPEAIFTLAGHRAIDFVLRAPALKKDAFEPEALEEYHQAFGSLERLRSAFAYYRTVTRQTIIRALPRPGRGAPKPPKPIEMPLLVIWGIADPALPVELADGIARSIPHARVERVADAGHFVPEEQPEIVAALLKEFFV